MRATPILVLCLIASTGAGTPSTSASAAAESRVAESVAAESRVAESVAADPAVGVTAPADAARPAHAAAPPGPAPRALGEPTPAPPALDGPAAPPSLAPPVVPPLLRLASAPAEASFPNPPKASARAAVAAIDTLGGSGARAPSVWLGTASLDRATGELAVGARGAEPVYTASLSKLIIVVDVLDRRQSEGLAVTEADARLIQRALGPSDDGAMSALWGRFDGYGSARRMSERLGLTATQPPRDPSQWGEMMTSAADVARIYEHLLDELPAEDRDFVISSLASAPPVRGADGFDQGYGLLAPDPGLRAVAKQAWMCCHGQQFTLHSAGLVHSGQAWSTVQGPRYVLVLLSRQPRGAGWSAATDVLTQAAGVAGRAFDG